MSVGHMPNIGPETPEPYGCCRGLVGSGARLAVVAAAVVDATRIVHIRGEHGTYLQGNFGKPGKLSLNPLSHIAQLSVAKDHSPTMTGPKALHGVQPLLRAAGVGEKFLLVSGLPRLVDVRVHSDVWTARHEAAPISGEAKGVVHHVAPTAAARRALHYLVPLPVEALQNVDRRMPRFIHRLQAHDGGTIFVPFRNCANNPQRHIQVFSVNARVAESGRVEGADPASISDAPVLEGHSTHQLRIFAASPHDAPALPILSKPF